ncbi:MAG: DUF4974 domain-containing protein, partial [Cyclobacteriaceae bacterium]|nr:DUF4974 domain-containing protein [Cyclobacteriaceae bacterium HetDA_MAG_MS6]
KLQGEAFFEVIKNPEKVFVVKSAGLQTQVLGTKFNVSNYQHERASVTVLSGKVQVRSKTTREPVTLVKDERVTYLSHSGDLIKDHVDAAALASWTQGIIHFDNTSLRHVAQVLERWYGVSVVFENEEAKSCTISGKYINPTLESVLESIQFVKGLDYAIDEYQVTLKGKNCES